MTLPRREYMRDLSKKRIASQRALGLCTINHCGNVPAPSRALCGPHASRMRSLYRARYASDPSRYRAKKNAWVQANRLQVARIQSWQRMGRRLLVIQERGGRCVDCGAGNPMVLQFDHVERRAKSFHIGATKSLERIRAEAAKCVLRCANCHQLKSWIHQDRKAVSP